MRIFEAIFNRRFNIGDYNHEDYTVKAEVKDGESIGAVLSELKSSVLAAFQGEPVKEETKTTKPAATEKAPKAKKEKANGKSAKASDPDDEDNSAKSQPEADSGADDEGDSNDETADDEASDDGDGSPESGEESEGDDNKSVKAKSTSGGKEGSKKTFKKKPQNYNRTIENHKQLFSGILGAVAPDWKNSDASKDKAKNASVKMDGKEFLDENGTVLPGFKAEVKNLMAKK